MSQSEEGSKDFDLFKVLRESRDSLMNAVAEVTLGVTSSQPYAAVSSALARPALFATGVSRKATAAAAAQFLAQMNMPSREDVLALSQRLTRIEMVLDDIRAAMDAAAPKSHVASVHPQRAAGRERTTEGGDGRSNGAAKAG